MKRTKLENSRKPRSSTARERRSVPFGKEILIMLALIAVAGVWRVVFHEFGHKKTPSSILTNEWQRYSPGKSQLSLLLPGEPQPEQPDNPESTLTNIKQASRYKYSLKAFDVAVYDVLYDEGTSTDIRQAADHTAATLKQSLGVTEYQDSVLAITRSGKPGLLIAGAFKRNGEKMKLEAVLLSEGSRLWQVIVTHPAVDRNSAIASRKVLESIAIDYKGVGALTPLPFPFDRSSGEE